MRRWLCGWVALCGMVLACAPVAVAAEAERGWPFEAAAPILLAFGERYPAGDGSHATHRGVDLGAPPGTGVRAVLAGTVTFAGRIPAGEGATTLAVTVQSGDILVTYLPLSDRVVATGQTVVAGELLGALASSGDRSHPDSHLHLSVRRGSLYVDPMPFLAAPLQAHSGAVPIAEPAPLLAAPAPNAAGATAGAPLAPAPSPADSPAPAHVQAPAPETVPETGQTVPGAFAGAQAALSGVAPSVARPHVSALAPAGVQARPAPAQPSAQDTPFVTPRPELAPLAVAALPPQAKRALAVDRREQLAGSAALPPGVLAGAACLLGVAFLWPLWRSTPRPTASFPREREDVAAVVAR
ncbi:MAG TPA: peptidoglycan DD-metalloendopeptidase family protein [Coriobacteriia bacterium]|nr:peptidoglycan DD-metalloendopeptidase family protein [Coriobacteriia bacterium]